LTWDWELKAAVNYQNIEMLLKQIYCQDKAIQQLQRAYASGRIPHAYIFAGPEGIGKFTTAKSWAKLLLCEKPVCENGFFDSCGQCPSCLAVDVGPHPDLVHIYKELKEFTKKAKKTDLPPVDLSIDVIREFLVDKITATAKMSQRRVFIVSEAEKLNNSSQNALLKVLEEPPDFCSIILICTRPEQLLPTTKSRCQIIMFGSIDRKRIVEKLSPMDLEPTKAEYFAALAQGSIGTAYMYAQLELAGIGLYDTKSELIESLAQCKLPNSLELSEWMCSKVSSFASGWSNIEKNTSKADIKRSTAKVFIRIIISALHDSMMTSLSESGEIVNFDQKRHIHTLAQRFSPEIAAEKIDSAYKAARYIDASVNEKLIFDQLLLNLTNSATMLV